MHYILAVAVAPVVCADIPTASNSVFCTLLDDHGGEGDDAAGVGEGVTIGRSISTFWIGHSQVPTHSLRARSARREVGLTDCHHHEVEYR